MELLRGIFELQRGGHGRLFSMEGLRGIAVILVFLVHYVTLIDPWLPYDSYTTSIAYAARSIGHSGVDLFFVLSGYLIYATLIVRKHLFVSFMVRRLIRIYPAFLAVLVLYIVLSFAFPAESKLPSGAGPMLIYILQNFFLLPGLFPIEPIITVAWSLSYEMFFYLTLPLIIVALGLHRWPAKYRVWLFLALAVVLTIWCSVNAGPLRMIMFVAGILLYETVTRWSGKISNWGGFAALFGGFAITLILREIGASGLVRVWVLFFTFYMLCLGCFAGDGPTQRMFSWTPLRWLGNMSYSYYLLHGLALKAIFLIFGLVHGPSGTETVLFWLLLLPAFVLTLLPSAVLFVLIERPYSLVRRSHIEPIHFGSRPA